MAFATKQESFSFSLKDANPSGDPLGCSRLSEVSSPRPSASRADLKQGGQQAEVGKVRTWTDQLLLCPVHIEDARGEMVH